MVFRGWNWFYLMPWDTRIHLINIIIMRVSAMCDDCQKMHASVNVPPTNPKYRTVRSSRKFMYATIRRTLLQSTAFNVCDGGIMRFICNAVGKSLSRSLQAASLLIRIDWFLWRLLPFGLHAFECGVGCVISWLHFILSWLSVLFIFIVVVVAAAATAFLFSSHSIGHHLCPNDYQTQIYRLMHFR